MPPHPHARLTAVALALATAFAQAQPAFPPPSPAAKPDPDRDRLPDLAGAAQKGGPAYNFSASGNGANLDRRDAGSRLTTHVESSQRTGSAIGITGGMALGDTAALGGGIGWGANKREFFANLGWNIDAAQRLMLTGSQLRQDLDFDFPSGRAKADLVQNAAGVSYRMALTGRVLDHLELNAYRANTASRDLGAVDYAVDTAALYELWRDPRRVAGGRVEGIQGNTGLVPWQGGRLDFGLGHERLRYDFLGGAENHARGTARVEVGQMLTANTRLKLGADGGAAQKRVSLGLDVAVEGGQLGLALDSVQGRDGAPNDNRVRISWVLPLGGRRMHAAPFSFGGRNSATGGAGSGTPLVDQVAVRPNWIPSQVVAMLDKTATPTRLVAIDKTALPAGSSVGANGIITTPLGVVITGIAGVTKNGGAFANTGQFALSGNSLVINPNLIVQPAVGVVDVYVVTANNAGGGTTLITINVSHGSVRIDSIRVTSIPATAPTASAVSIGGTAQVGQTLTGAYTYADVNSDPQGTSTFRWLRNGVAIAGATAITYTLVAADQGKTIMFEVTPVATIAPTTGTPAVSSATVAVAGVGTPAAPTASAVSISGTAQVGQTLTGSYTYADANNDPQGISTIRWLRNGAAIAGATATTYTPVAADQGNTITFEVTPVATAAPTTGTPVLSSATAAVAGIPVAPPPPANSAPTANNFTYGTNVANVARTFSWLALSAAADADGDTLTATVPTQGTKGSCAVAGNNVTYTPNSGQTGSDTCGLRINDGNGNNKDIVVSVNGVDTYAAPPTGLAFTEGALSSNANINITGALAAGADTAEWFVQWDSATTPAAGAGGWSSTKPTTGTIPSLGSHTMYVYAKDALGNVSAPVNRSIVYDLAPTIPSTPVLPLTVGGGTSIGAVSATFADEQVWGGASAISITANNGATITGGPFGGSYGAKNFGITAPAWTGVPVTITITYSVTDSNGLTTTVTDTIDTTP